MLRHFIAQPAHKYTLRYIVCDYIVEQYDPPYTQQYMFGYDPMTRYSFFLFTLIE